MIKVLKVKLLNQILLLTIKYHPQTNWNLHVHEQKCIHLLIVLQYILKKKTVTTMYVIILQIFNTYFACFEAELHVYAYFVLSKYHNKTHVLVSQFHEHKIQHLNTHHGHTCWFIGLQYNFLYTVYTSSALWTFRVWWTRYPTMDTGITKNMATWHTASGYPH